MSMKKFIFEFFEDYFWIIGLTLVVSGVVLIFTDPIGILITGIIFVLLGAGLRGYNKADINHYQGTIISKEGKELGHLMKAPN